MVVVGNARKTAAAVDNCGDLAMILSAQLLQKINVVENREISD